MSLKTRTQEVLEAGKAKRGDWQPEKGSWSERRYQYYHKRTGKGRENENFCRFWRVATIWATKERWAERAENVSDKTYGIIAVLVYALIISLFAQSSAWLVSVIIVAVPLAVAGIISTVELLRKRSRWEEPLTDKQRKLAWVFAALAFPVSLPIAGLTWVIRRWPSEWNETVVNVILGIFSLGVLALFVFFIIDTFHDWTWAAVITIAIVAVIVTAVVAAFAFAAVLISGFREKKKEARQNEYERRLDAGEPVEYTAIVHPFSAWLGRLFTNIGDIIIFVAQVVRVKKWKVCPLVQMDLDDEVDTTKAA
jgi:MFS family permease